MLRLPLLPAHVLPPTDGEMDLARQIGLEVPSRRWSQATCRLCSGTRRFVRWGGMPTSSEPVEYECPCEDQMILDRWMGVRGLPLRYRTHTIYDALLGVSKVDREWLTKWLSEWESLVRYGVGAVLHGPPGSGKTIMATLVLKAALGGGVTSGRFFSAGSTWNLNQWSNVEFRDYWNMRVKNAQFLVMDNLATESGVLKQQDEIASMLRSRAASGYTTIVTTNLSPDKIREHYGEGVYSALGDVCDFVRVSRDAPFDLRNITEAERALGIMRPVVFG